jgi:hypothetical protein
MKISLGTMKDFGLRGDCFNDWAIIPVGQTYHAIPRDDLEEHTVDGFCKCGAREDPDDPDVEIQHNSFDGRETYDDGTRKFH